MNSLLDYYKVILLVIMVLVVENVNARNTETKYYKTSVHNTWDQMENNEKNTTATEKGRGLFLGGGLLALGKVLNFFPVGGERECQPQSYSIAKAGICINQYDCRQRDGRAAGDCAHGLGVCCVFEVTCGGVVQNNLTYFMSPGFPELWVGDQDCNITIEKTYAGIMQLRIDFIHFTIGQPNRFTGDCDEDAMILGDGDSSFKICGQNHGQHVYYTLSTASEKRESGELAGTKDISLTMRMRGGDMPRLWLMRFAQMPLAYTAPHNCLQYFTENNGTIKTFNFATNGRHLASQDYKACIRKNTGICSIRYTPCSRRSFMIGQGSDTPIVMDPADIQDDDQMMPVNDDMMTQDDETEGSGAEPQIAPVEAPANVVTRMWRYIWSWMWGQARATSAARWSPYAQHFGAAGDDAFRYLGYGTFGAALAGLGRLRCRDRVTILCENEYLISSSSIGSGVCDPHHCGNNFCPGQPHRDCKVETSITPFSVAVRFGPPKHKRSPEENIGMCLRYIQLPCDS